MKNSVKKTAKIIPAFVVLWLLVLSVFGPQAAYAANTSDRINIDGATVTGVEGYYHAGDPLPNIRVVKNGVLLKEGTDYRCSIQRGMHPKNTYLSICGIGNYTGYISVPYPEVRDVKYLVEYDGEPGTIPEEEGVFFPMHDRTYTGNPIEATCMMLDIAFLEWGAYTEWGTDFTATYDNNVNVGRATVTLTGKGYYTGTKTIHFNIKPKRIARTIIKTTKAYYTGKEIVPEVSVTDYDTKRLLEEGKDYELSYENHVANKKVEIKITGLGNYTGEKNYTMWVSPRRISGVSVGSISNKAYTGKEITPKPVLKENGKVLKAGTDYTLSYENNKNIGKAKVIIKGIGNYAGTISKSFKIVPARPKAPSVSNANKGFQIKWNRIRGADGYQVWRSGDNGKTYSKAKTLYCMGQTSFTNTAKAANVNGKKYKYKVRAFKFVDDKTYYGAFSPMKASYKVSRPGKPSVTKNSDGGITVSWKKNSKASGYKIRCKSGSKVLTLKVKNKSKHQKTIYLPGNNKTYQISVRAYKTVSGTNYNSAWSKAKSVKITS